MTPTPPTHDWTARARETIEAWRAHAENYGNKTGLFADFMTTALQSAYEQGLEDALEVVDERSYSNVENPAIDWSERQRRSGIRWAGEYIRSGIRALKESR